MSQYLKTYKMFERIGFCSDSGGLVADSSATTAVFNKLFIISTGLPQGSPKKGGALLLKQRLFNNLLKQRLFNNQLLGQLGLRRVPLSLLGGTEEAFKAAGTALYLTEFDVADLPAEKTPTKAQLSQYAGRKIKAFLSSFGLCSTKWRASGGPKKLPILKQHHLLGCVYVSPVMRSLFISEAELKQSYLAQAPNHCGTVAETVLRLNKANLKRLGPLARKPFRKMLLLLNPFRERV